MWASLSFEPVLRFWLGTPFVFNILSRVFQLVHFAMWRSYYVTWFDSFDMCFVYKREYRKLGFFVQFSFCQLPTFSMTLQGSLVLWDIFIGSNPHSSDARHLCISELGDIVRQADKT